MKKFIHKLTKSAHSYYIVIPKEIVKKYGWQERQKFTVKDKGRGEIEIKDWRNKK
jgi:bifunctional DNA-binding transcriptional regulator/antitoxin component of YhaV-PrlF toxin-antitoxin module